MGKKKTAGIGLVIASVAWFVGWLWLFEFEWVVFGICLLALVGGIALILED